LTNTAKHQYTHRIVFMIVTESMTK